MIAGGNAAKNILGLAKTEYKNGKYKVTPRKALYKELPFYKEESAKAIKDLCATKTFMGKHIFKHAPTVVKGGLFAAASITSFALGDKAGHIMYDEIHENDNQQTTQAKFVEMTPEKAADTENLSSEQYSEAV